MKVKELLAVMEPEQKTGLLVDLLAAEHLAGEDAKAVVGIFRAMTERPELRRVLKDLFVRGFTDALTDEQFQDLLGLDPDELDCLSDQLENLALCGQGR